jgi:actin-like protein 6A
MTGTSLNIPGGDDVNAVVLDVGASNFRSGFSGEDVPRVFEQSTFQFPVDADVDMGSRSRPAYSPANFLFPSSDCRFKHALQPDVKVAAIDVDADVLEQIIRYSFFNAGRTLNIDVSDSPLIMTEPNRTNDRYRRTCLETSFEKFGFPAASLLKRACGSAFASGKQSGLIVDVGASMTSVTPVFDGFVLQKPTAEFYGIGGDLLDNILDELLKRKKVNVHPFYKQTQGVDAKYLTASRLAVVRELKHEVCKMSGTSLSSVTGFANWHLTLQGEGASAACKLPDGTELDLAPFHQVLPELLFDPTPIGSIPHMGHMATGFSGIGTAALECVANCDIDARKAVSSDVILCGGSSLFANMPDRLLKFIQTPDNGKTNNLVPLVKPKVTAAPVAVDRMSTSWLGCSIVASCATFQHLWISKRQFEEEGLERISAKQLFW